jgi:hypothetical protein
MPGFGEKTISLIKIGLDDSAVWGRRKKGGPKMKVSLAMLLKTHVEKMSLRPYATILMKTGKLDFVCHDVDEEK